MSVELPSQAETVVIGGGIVGCSVAYHLAKLGRRDIVLLEQGRLSGGTTWHAAGLVGQLRVNQDLTKLIRYSTDLYETLEEETGQATGWKRCGSIAVARTADRMTALRRTASAARAFGIEAEVIGPAEAGRLWPVMRTDDLEGALWIPADGKANPSDVTQALAKGARAGGVSILEGVKVTGIEMVDGMITGVETDHGKIRCETVVNCAGQWARQVGAMAGVAVPLHSCEHMYIVTRQIEGVLPDLPVLRDYDGMVYFKEEVGGLVMGGFEPQAKPWGMDGIPDGFEFTLLPDDWDQFEILMQNAIERVPALETVEVRQFVNGPESFTPDAHFILGEAPEVEGFFVGAGFNSMGIASAGGAGKALAEWIVDGAPTLDLWPVDIRRFNQAHNGAKYLRERVSEVLGVHYMMPWPNRELTSARPLRRSALHDRLRAKGACFGVRMGWERPLWYSAKRGDGQPIYSYSRQDWFSEVEEECKAVREGVGLFDQSSFAKFTLQGRHAEPVLQTLCANDVAVPPGRIVYTPMLNEQGGYESDLTVTRVSAEEYFIVTGAAQAVRDRDWIARHTPPDADAYLTDLTSAFAVLGLMGPRARDVLSAITDAPLDNLFFPVGTMQEIDIAHIAVRAMRVTYVGELGWELYMPVESALTVYAAIEAAGAECGLRDAGYYAMESLRLEKGYRSWGHELAPDVTPYEAGLAFAVRFDEDRLFNGREALLQQADGQPRRRVLQFLVDDPDPVLYGDELILRDGAPIGQIRSGAYGFTFGRSVGLGLVDVREEDGDAADPQPYQIDIGGTLYDAKAYRRTPYDPKGERIRA